MEAMDTYDEPMDVDTSQFLAPSTPLPDKQPNGNHNDISMNGSPRSAQRSAKAVKNGPKIVKGIRPNGGSPPNSIGKSAGRRPPGFDPVNGDGSGGAEMDEFTREHYNGSLNGTYDSGANPFQTRKMLARTPSPNSSSTRHFDDFPVRGTEPAEKLVLSDGEGSNEVKSRAEKPCETETDQLGYYNRNGSGANTNGINGSVDADSTVNMLNDEWETHKKRATTAQNVNISIPPYDYQAGDGGSAWQEPSPPNKPVSNSSSSNVSSTTDISSANSVSPNPIEHDVDAAVCRQPAESGEQMNAMQERASSQSQLTSSSAASLSSATSNNEPSDGEKPVDNHQATPAISSSEEQTGAANNTTTVTTTTITTPNVTSINDDLTNVTNTNSNMDTLTPEPEMVKSQEIENAGGADDFVPCIDADPFKTPQKQEETDSSAQNKRLNFVNSRYNSGVTTANASSFETGQTTLLDLEDSSAPAAVQSEAQQQFGNQQGEAVLFDSIFTNDTDFQSFLDLLEKKEGDSANKTSPAKFSEFARKSLYLQFDPIIQSRSLSPEKIRRLSVIRDKQEAIKSFLNSEEANNRTPQATKTQPTLVEIEEEPETEPEPAAKAASASINAAETTVVVKEKKANGFTVEIREPEKKVNVKAANKSKPPMDSLVSSTASFNNELDKEEILSNGHDAGVSDSGSDLGRGSSSGGGGGDDLRDQQPFLKRGGLQRSSENVNSIASENAGGLSSTSDLAANGDQNGAELLTTSLTNGNGHHDDIKIKAKSTSNDDERKDNFDDADDALLAPPSKPNQQAKTTTTTTITNSNSTTTTTNTNGNEHVKDNESVDEDMKMLMSNNKQGFGARPNVTSKKAGAQPTNGVSTNKLAFAGTGVTNDDDKSQPSDWKERERAHLERISLLEEENEKFKTVAIEFERIFHNLIKDKEESESKLKTEIIELTKERDHLQEDVVGVERAFDDLHRRFEKLKTKVEEFKKNEETLQNALESYKQQLEKEKMKYTTLKKHAEEKIDLANSEIDKLRKSTSIEIQTLKAELRKAEIKTSSLELSVQQKDQENSQLTNLLEDLLSKVKPNA